MGRLGSRAADAGELGLTVLFSPDSFKGSFSSVEVATAFAKGWAAERPFDTLIEAPLADGGEGTLAAVAAGGGWLWRTCSAHDPLGRERAARWLASRDGSRAIVELAAASGLSLVPPGERDPRRATSRGTGDVLRDALDQGIRDVVLGLGGSATTDGGAGLLAALGVWFLDANGEPLADGGGPLADLARIDLAGLDRRLGELRLRVAGDVANPLLGPNGAAAIYGPQKGASATDVAELDAALTRFADVLEAVTGRGERSTRGAGAAGGATFGLACLADRLAAFEIRPGVELVMEEIDLAGKLAAADLVVTGEGRIDAQTAFGKTALGVARLAAERHVPCVAIGGGVTPEGSTALARLGAPAVPAIEQPGSADEAIAAGSAPLARAAARIARLITIGLELRVADPDRAEA